MASRTFVSRIRPFLKHELATLSGAAKRRFATPDSRPPPRARIERKLRSAGLGCVVIGDKRRKNYVLKLASPTALLVWGAATVVWSLSSLVVVWDLLGREGTYRFVNFLPFDVLGGVTLVLSFLAWHVLRNRGDARLARSVAMTGLAVTGLVLAAPYLLFSAAHVDTTAAGWLSVSDISAGSEQQAVLPHGLIALAAAVAVVIEAGLGPGRRSVSLARSAARSIPRTMVDVVRTLPAVLTVLLFFGFVEEIWRIFGGMSAQSLAVVIGILFLTVVAVVMRLAKAEAEKALDEEARNCSREFGRIADHDHDIKALLSAGALGRPASVSQTIRAAVIHEWRVHIVLRVVLAGFSVAVLMIIITSLTMSKDVLDNWIDPETWIDIDPLGIHVYLAQQAIPVAAMLGSFASVVFAGSILSENDSREEMLEPERKRLRQLLALAGTYESADERKIWRGRPGETWKTYPEFLADYPDRRIRPRIYGKNWSSANGRGRWQLEYNQLTGEVYAWRRRPPGEVEVLAVSEDSERVAHTLLELQRREEEADSLAVLRDGIEQLSDHGQADR